MSFTDRVLDGLGPAYRARAGVLLADLVVALTDQISTADQLVQPTDRGWAAAFDVPTTPDPAWLANATGTHIPAGLTLEQQRDYLAGQPAWRRGTVEAMEVAVRTVLVGLQRVEILERIDDDPSLFGVRVHAADLPGGDTPENRAAVIAAALTQKPLGLSTDVDIDVI